MLLVATVVMSASFAYGQGTAPAAKPVAPPPCGKTGSSSFLVLTNLSHAGFCKPANRVGKKSGPHVLGRTVLHGVRHYTPVLRSARSDMEESASIRRRPIISKQGEGRCLLDNHLRLGQRWTIISSPGVNTCRRISIPFG